MDNKRLAYLLKAIIIFLSLMGFGFFAAGVPFFLSLFVEAYPEFGGIFLPWLIFLIVAAVPLYVILGLGITVSNEIGRDNSFCMHNVKCLNGVAFCLIAESVYFFAGNTVLWLLNMNHPLIVLLSLVLSLFAASIAFAVKILAHLIEKAVKLREENEAII